MKRIVSLLAASALMLSMLAACGDQEADVSPSPSSPSPSPTQSETQSPSPSPSPSESTEPDGYIPAPYTAASEDELIAEFLEPVFYENGEGEPTIGVTLLGVIRQDGKYFRDLNNNQELDDFEDWRLDAETRAKAMAAALTDNQLTHQVVNCMAYSPSSVKVEDVVGDDGKPDWTKLYPAVGGFGAKSEAPNNLEWLNSTNLRTYVLRNNPETEVAVWFNNGLEQYSEFYAIQNENVTVPYFTFTNPIAHGLPGSEGVTAAALGDGNADFLLTDAEYDRQVMWAKGVDGLYGPQVDLVTDPRWSRNSGTYGEREDMSAEISKNLTIGYQNGDQGMVPGSVLITIKHFPGDGAAFNGFESHGQTGRYRIYSVENSLADYQLKPFIAAFEAGAAGVMPAYSQPIIDERIAPQSITYNGKTSDIRYEGRGNAFNEDILLGLLRDVLGFKGLINSDSLQMAAQQGVEDLDAYERMVLFIKAGCDCGVIGFDGFNVQQMNATGGATGGEEDAPQPSDLLDQALEAGDVTREDLERAAANRLKPQMQSGNLDNPYRDIDESVKTVNDLAPSVKALAEETHLKSVVLMKNSNDTMPLSDASKTIYVGGYNQKDDANVDGLKEALKAQGYTVVDDYNTADIAYLRVSPTIVGTGSSQLAILDLAEDVETPVYDNNAKRTDETAVITTVANMKGFQKVADAVHANGGKVIGEIVATSPWILTNMEPYCDALLGTFSTSDAAISEVVAGKYAPTGKLPITMVADASVIALNETDLNGEIWDVCVSPNDVPGYVKDQYMDEAVLAASPSGSYAYKDADGNVYMSNFGLTFTATGGPTGGNGGEAPANSEAPAASTNPGTPADATTTGLNYDSHVTALEGSWKLSQVVAGGEVKDAVTDAMQFKVTLEEDPSELVDGAAYIHNRVYNLSGVLTFGIQAIQDELDGEDIEEYKGSTSWEDFPQGKVVEEGQWYEQPGPAVMRFKDIDICGLFLDQVAGILDNIDTTEKNLILGMNAAGQLLLGFSEEHLERPGTSGDWTYCLIFDKA